MTFPSVSERGCPPRCGDPFPLAQCQAGPTSTAPGANTQGFGRRRAGSLDLLADGKASEHEQIRPPWFLRHLVSDAPRCGCFRPEHPPLREGGVRDAQVGVAGEGDGDGVAGAPVDLLHPVQVLGPRGEEGHPAWGRRQEGVEAHALGAPDTRWVLGERSVLPGPARRRPPPTRPPALGSTVVLAPSSTNTNRPPPKSSR